MEPGITFLKTITNTRKDLARMRNGEPFGTCNKFTVKASVSSSARINKATRVFSSSSQTLLENRESVSQLLNRALSQSLPQSKTNFATVPRGLAKSSSRAFGVSWPVELLYKGPNAMLWSLFLESLHCKSCCHVNSLVHRKQAGEGGMTRTQGVCIYHQLLSSFGCTSTPNHVKY